MNLNELFADQCSRYYTLDLPKIGTIKIWYGNTAFSRCLNKRDLNTYETFEFVVTWRSFSPRIKLEKTGYYFMDDAEHLHCLCVPKEMFLQYLRKLMRLSGMCPGPWMTEEERLLDE